MVHGRSRSRCVLFVLPLLVLLLRPPLAAAQMPAMATTDETGAVAVRAVRVKTPLRIDGRLDEELYSTVAPLTDLIQTEPTPGALVTEKTEVWVAFDRDNVYVTFRCWETHPERLASSELRRDNNLIMSANDNVTWAFDTFHDRRNSFVFIVGPDGGRIDGQSTAEKQWSPDWNPVWNVKTGRFEGGWTVEAAIPFKSLRYRVGTAQEWGFTARRMSRWKNEIAYLTPVPNGSNSSAIMRTSFYATLYGIEAPSGARNLEIKPFATADLTTDRVATPRLSNDPGGDVGVDAKYGLSQNLSADFTYNTDFAQVEADEQQVNLTRFSLFFPEKREFFLENQGTFAFGGAGTVSTTATDLPTLFYSRRIGLESGRAVPILGGGRLTGRVGDFELGLMNIESNDEPLSRSQPTNFTAIRLKRDIFRKSSIGAILTNRSRTPARPTASQTYGVDGTFAFGKNLSVATYWARVATPGVTRDDASYRAQLDYNADRYGLQAERLRIGDNFNPEVGFVRRDDMRKTYGYLRFSPRPASKGLVKKYSWSADTTYIEDSAGIVETRQTDGDFSIEFQNSDKLLLGATDHYELLPAPFTIAPGVTLPAAGYGFRSLRAGFNFGQQRKVFGNLSLEHGEFYDGRTSVASFRAARIEVTPRISAEPSVSVNRVRVSAGSFTTTLVGSRLTYTITPLTFVSALIQYNNSTNSVSSNVRFRWEYHPGSELFVVYNEQRDTFGPHFPDLANRSVILKINRLFRF